jgi:hypothetical protein
MDSEIGIKQLNEGARDLYAADFEELNVNMQEHVESIIIQRS